MTTEYRKAPEGFSKVQWDAFQRDGILVVEQALTDDEIETYLDGIDRVCAAEGSPRSDGFLGTQNFIEKDPTCMASN